MGCRLEEHPKNVATVEADNSNVVWYTTSIWAEKLVKTIRPTKVNVENRDLLDLCRANPCSAPSRVVARQIPRKLSVLADFFYNLPRFIWSATVSLLLCNPI